MKSNLIFVPDNEKISAKAKGYSFCLSDDVWDLEKGVSINVCSVKEFIHPEIIDSFLMVLSYYARNFSAHHTKNCFERFSHYLSRASDGRVTPCSLINYRSLLCKEREWYLGVIRGFIRRWHRLGYPGISEDVIRLLDGWRIRGNRKGDAVKRKDSTQGPLTDIELQAFNEGVVRAFEEGQISLSELALCLLVSHTGRRPIQIAHVKVGDILQGRKHTGETYYLVNIPRAKQGAGFRSDFRPFAVTAELWSILSDQAKQAVRQVESAIGVKLQDADKAQVPLFPDMKEVKRLSNVQEYRALTQTDRLHIAPAEVTDTLHFVVEAAEIRSERTGDVLHANARRFRYTIGTRAAREGFGELVIAELLDHSDTQNAGVYIKNIPEHVERLDEAVGMQLAPYAQAFCGVLVDSEKDAKRGDDPTSRIRTEEGRGIGTCGEMGFCGANAPIPCYTCSHFQPWLDGPHETLYQRLLEERERVLEITGDEQVAKVLDRSILAVAQVIQLCEKRKAELAQNG